MATITWDWTVNSDWSQSIDWLGAAATVLTEGFPDGGIFIQGGSVSVNTVTLDAPSSSTVTFNGENGELQLLTPDSFTGSLVGFGAGDTIDLVGVASSGATLVGGTLDITDAGNTVYRLDMVGDYSTASFSGGPDAGDGTLITVSGVAARDYAFEGPVWQDTTITWSLATSQYAGAFGSAHPFSSFINATTQAAEVTVIQQALQTWANVAGISFVQVADSASSQSPADLRIGWGSLLNSGGELGDAAYASAGGNFMTGTILRLQDPAQDQLVSTPSVMGGLTYSGQTATLFQVAMHEIGRALGLADSTDPGAVMFATAQGVLNQTVDASDIAGIQALYPEIACYAEGTRILTTSGETAIEALRPGDLIPGLVSGRLRRVRWIGRRLVAPARHPRPGEVHPVCIQAHAFGPGRPHRDLRVSPNHAIWHAGALLPARLLLNGRSVRREAVRTITYCHVELEDHAGRPVHDVVLAENLPAESYLDTGHREGFAVQDAIVRLHPDFAPNAWDASACAPLHLGGAVVEAARRYLSGQSSPSPQNGSSASRTC